MRKYLSRARHWVSIQRERCQRQHIRRTWHRPKLFLQCFRSGSETRLRFSHWIFLPHHWTVCWRCCGAERTHVLEEIHQNRELRTKRTSTRSHQKHSGHCESGCLHPVCVFKFLLRRTRDDFFWASVYIRDWTYWHEYNWRIFAGVSLVRLLRSRQNLRNGGGEIHHSSCSAFGGLHVWFNLRAFPGVLQCEKPFSSVGLHRGGRTGVVHSVLFRAHLGQRLRFRWRPIHVSVRYCLHGRNDDLASSNRCSCSRAWATMVSIHKLSSHRQLCFVLRMSHWSETDLQKPVEETTFKQDSFSVKWTSSSEQETVVY